MADYLNTFINDSEAWAELGDLYLQEMDFARGIFCFEELLLTYVRLWFSTSHNLDDLAE